MVREKPPQEFHTLVQYRPQQKGKLSPYRCGPPVSPQQNHLVGMASSRLFIDRRNHCSRKRTGKPTSSPLVFPFTKTMACICVHAVSNLPLLLALGMSSGAATGPGMGFKMRPVYCSKLFIYSFLTVCLLFRGRSYTHTHTHLLREAALDGT